MGGVFAASGAIEVQRARTGKEGAALGRNLFIGIKDYTSSKPYSVSSTATDGYTNTGIITVQLDGKGGNHVLQIQTNRDIAPSPGSSSATIGKVTVWLYLCKSYTAGEGSYDSAICFNASDKTFGKTTEGAYYWIYNMPAGYTRAELRVNTYSDGKTAQSANFWNMKLEVGDRPTAFCLNEQDLVGKDGADAITLDLDNEMDSVACDSNATIQADTTIVTNTKLFKGANVITSGVTAKADSVLLMANNVVNIKPTITVANGVANIKYVLPKGFRMQIEKQSLNITLTYNNKSYTSVFTLNAIKSGTPGVSPTIYQLKVTPDSLSFNRSATDDNAFSPSSISVTCGYTKNVDGKITTVSDGSAVIDNKYYIYYKRTDAANWIRYAGAIVFQGTYNTGLEFCISSSSTASGVSTGNIIDRETIPVVKQGVKGDKGDSEAVNGWEVTYAISNNGQTPPANGWQKTPPKTTDSNPYLWARIITKYKLGADTTSYSVAKQGTGIKQIDTYYKNTGNDSTQPSDQELTNAGTNFPSVSQGDYVWSMTVVSYTDGTSSKSYACNRIGFDGDVGAGVHIAYADSVDENIIAKTGGYVSSSDYVTGFTTTWQKGKQWIGVYVSNDTKDVSDVTKYQWSKIKGETGDVDEVTGTEDDYAVNNDYQNPPKSGWQKTPPKTTDANPYLWTRTTTHHKYSKDTYSYTRSDRGSQGIQGIQGLMIRDSIWQIGNEYRNDSKLTSGLRYLDVVYLEREDGKYNCWQYNSDKPSVSTNDNKPQTKLDSSSNVSLAVSAGCWTAINNFGPLYAPLIITDNIKFKLGQTNQILIQDSKGNIQGCFGGVEDETNGYPLWIGGKTADEAKFKVKFGGQMYATDANISGTINATSGRIAGFKINGNYIGINPDNKDDNIGMWLDDTEIGFNGSDGRQVSIGVSNILGLDYMGIFKDSGWEVAGPFMGVEFSLKNKAQFADAGGSVAINITGGCIRGFATKTYQMDSSETIPDGVNAVIINNTTNNSFKQVNITLPTMNPWNDGFHLKIKLISKVVDKVYLNAGSTNIYESEKADVKTVDSWMNVDRNSSVKRLEIQSPGDAMEFVYFHSLVRENAQGCWVQWKNPRDW